MAVGNGNNTVFTHFFGDGVFRVILHVDEGLSILGVCTESVDALIDVIGDRLSLTDSRQALPNGGQGVALAVRGDDPDGIDALGNRYGMGRSVVVRIGTGQREGHVFPLPVLVVRVVPDLGRGDGGFCVEVIEDDFRGFSLFVLIKDNGNIPCPHTVDGGGMYRSVVCRGGGMSAGNLFQRICIDAVIKRQLRELNYPWAFAGLRILSVFGSFRHRRSLGHRCQGDAIGIRFQGRGFRRDRHRKFVRRRSLLHRLRCQRRCGGHRQQQGQQRAQPFLRQHHRDNPPLRPDQNQQSKYTHRKKICFNAPPTVPFRLRPHPQLPQKPLLRFRPTPPIPGPSA